MTLSKIRMLNTIILATIECSQTQVVLADLQLQLN